ncbi:splicing factor 3A subunit 2 [Trypanosoma grayi]|uniref:splicing factor 3A subunit 2 n=1 Tax=Trypanosoma grayi TaxID=71804 RepID=UPI0004F44589|nr:splicing factor 3A subunit 2 [Trypanosoma grayi]KEG09473.1 splicing factor 3A subunit 2 [Trypanosoma grayi]
MFQTKVWLEFFFPQAVAGARPLHRWRSAREQEMERPPDDDVVYLLVACEGYMTVALKFPARLPRTSAAVPTMPSWGYGTAAAAGGGTGNTDEEEGKYRCNWDPLKKVYSLFFIIG